MKTLFPVFFLIFLLAAFSVTGQQMPGRPGQNPNQKTFEIKGKVIEKSTQQPLEYATIVIKPLKGDRILGGITDSKGKFSIFVPQGEYHISVEFISFKTHSEADMMINKDTDLGTIVLFEDSESLQEVQVIAEKSTVEIKLDKKIYTVGKDMTVKGGNAADVLNNVPSVSVDVEGVVSLRGNENVQILINGKPNSLVGQSNNEALRQFTAEMIEKVEVVTSPSARYDAEGTAGIINIIIKKGSADGFNGNATVNAGYPSSAGGSYSINYRKDKFNFFNNTGYSYSDSPGNSYTYTEYFNSQTAPFLIEDRDNNRVSKNFNINFGMEYYITESSTLTGSILYRGSDGNDDTENKTTTYDENFIKSNFYLRESEEENESSNWQYSLNYLNNFNSSGHKLNLDFQFEDNYRENFTYITEEEQYPVYIDKLDEKANTEDPQKQYLFQGDYVLPFKNDQQFEAGFRSNITDQTTDYAQYFENEAGDFVLDENLSNIFNYDEKIHALYSQYGKKFTKFSGLLGLRMEVTDIDIEIVDRPELEAHKNYTNFFPTINLAYELGEQENITLGYNRRIRRPRSRMINPFPSRTSETNIFQGNPYLDPSITDAIELGYSNRWKEVTLNTSVYYNHATDIFQMISEATGDNTQDGIPIIRRSPINLSTEERYGFEIAANYTPIKNWRFNLSFNLFDNKISGFYNDIDFGAETLSWFTRFSAKIVLPFEIDWQTNMMYMGPNENAQNEYKGMFSTDMAFSKDIMKGNGTLTFNISDLFNTRKREMETLTDTFYSESEFQWQQRQFRLAFTYRFNQKKKREMNRNFEGGEMEMMGG